MISPVSNQSFLAVTPQAEQAEQEEQAKAWIDTIKKTAPNESVIHQAACAGRTDVVSYLLKVDAKIDLNSRDHSGYTVLGRVVSLWAKNYSIILSTLKFLLNLPKNQRPDVNIVQNPSGQPLLHTAISYGDNDIARYLISLPPDLRPDVNGKDTSGLTPLHLAAEGSALFPSRDGHVSTVRALYSLPPGACPDANAQEKFGNTPLHLAAQWNNLGVIRELCKLPEGLRPNVNIRNNRGFTPLDIARKMRRYDVVTSLEDLNPHSRNVIRRIYLWIERIFLKTCSALPICNPFKAYYYV